MQKIKDMMTKEVDFCYPESNLQEVAQKMRDNDYGFIPIADREKEKFVGVVTDRDIVIRCVAEGKNPTSCTAQDAMTNKVLYCYDDDSIEDATKSMCSQQVRRLIVVNRDKKLCGVVSLGDIATESSNDNIRAETLEDVSKKSGKSGAAKNKFAA